MSSSVGNMIPNMMGQSIQISNHQPVYDFTPIPVVIPPAWQLVQLLQVLPLHLWLHPPLHPVTERRVTRTEPGGARWSRGCRPMRNRLNHPGNHGKIWENHGKSWQNKGKSWEIIARYGKIWENHGKSWQDMGKSWENMAKLDMKFSCMPAAFHVAL